MDSVDGRKGSPYNIQRRRTLALDRDPNKRWSTAAEMEEALHQASLDCDLVASRKEIGQWVKKLHRRELDERRLAVRDASMIRTEGANVTDYRSKSIVQQQATVDRAGLSSNASGRVVE